VCITSLLNTHQIISKTSDGGIFLNDRGIQSAQLCIGQSRRLATQGLVGQAPSVQVHVNTAGSSRAAYKSAHSVTTYQATSVIEERVRTRASEAVCIDLSDSDGDGYDSDTATIRATSMSPTRRPGGEPDAEPGYSLPPRPIGQNADPLDDLVRGGDEWEIVLLLDHREVLSRRNRDILERKLLEVNVTCEVRSLNVGDVQWVARRYRGFEAAEEFMLNVIVERKEVTDLSGSIIDRRYNEQKTRLRDSGMTHVIYLVEGSLTQQTTVRSSGLQTALCRTQVQNQFFVQQCQNADESVAFLRGVHMNLLAKLPAALTCRNREREPGRIPKLSSSTAPTVGDWKRQFCLPIRTYTDFNEQFRKKADFTVGEIYQMMLMQVHGLSSSRTVALAAEYPTFQHLAKAIARGEKLQDVRYGENQRRLGAKTHEFIKFLFESTDYEKDPPSGNGGSGGGGVLE
jgi:ERCC4-type nuclease